MKLKEMMVKIIMKNVDRKKLTDMNKIDSEENLTGFK